MGSGLPGSLILLVSISVARRWSYLLIAKHTINVTHEANNKHIRMTANFARRSKESVEGFGLIQTNINNGAF